MPDLAEKQGREAAAARQQCADEHIQRSITIICNCVEMATGLPLLWRSCQCTRSTPLGSMPDRRLLLWHSCMSEHVQRSTLTNTGQHHHHLQLCRAGHRSASVMAYSVHCCLAALQFCISCHPCWTTYLVACQSSGCTK